MSDPTPASPDTPPPHGDAADAGVGARANEAANTANEAAVRERLQSIAAYRGRVMPNHAVLAIEFPELLDRYETVYSITSLNYAVLAPHEKKFIMLLVVAATETPLGAYHVKEFIARGGTPEQAREALRLAMLAIGSSTLDSVAQSWAPFVPGVDYESYFHDGLIRPTLDTGVSAWVVELALAVAHACRRAWPKVGFHLQRAKALGVSDTAMAEALTTLILTAGNPIFVQACGVWQQLIDAGRIAATPLHRYAAELSRQR